MYNKTVHIPQFFNTFMPLFKIGYGKNKPAIR